MHEIRVKIDATTTKGPGQRAELADKIAYMLDDVYGLTVFLVEIEYEGEQS